MKNKRSYLWTVSVLAGVLIFAVSMQALDTPQVHAQRPAFHKAAAVILGPGGKTIAGPGVQGGQSGVPATVWGPTIASAICATLQVHANTIGPVELRVGDAIPVVIDPAVGKSGSQCDVDATTVTVECIEGEGEDCDYTWRVDMFW